MRRLALAVFLPLLSCTAGRSIGALHHPDLQLYKLATEAKGSGALFSHYQASGRVRWNQDWPWKLDLSGVAWDKPTTATLITARHVVMAAHYVRKPGEELVFHDRTGQRHARRVQKVVKLGDRGLKCDVAIGLLDRPLPESIRRYPLAAPMEDPTALIGATALVTEQKRTLFFHQVRTVHPVWLSFGFDERIPQSRKKNLISGDSGNPSFLLSKGELVLIQTHNVGGAGAGPFYGGKGIQEKMAEVIRELDPGHEFRTIAIDQRTLREATAFRESLPKRPPRTTAEPPKPSPTQPAPAAGEPRKPRPRVILPPRQPSTSPP